MRTSLCVRVVAFLFAGLAAFGQTSIDAPEFQARRKAALEKVPDGIVLLRSSWGLKTGMSPAFTRTRVSTTLPA